LVDFAAEPIDFAAAPIDFAAAMINSATALEAVRKNASEILVVAGDVPVADYQIAVVCAAVHSCPHPQASP